MGSRCKNGSKYRDGVKVQKWGQSTGMGSWCKNRAKVQGWGQGAKMGSKYWDGVKVQNWGQSTGMGSRCKNGVKVLGWGQGAGMGLYTHEVVLQFLQALFRVDVEDAEMAIEDLLYVGGQFQQISKHLYKLEKERQKHLHEAITVSLGR